MDKKLKYFLRDEYKVLKVMIENETMLMGKKMVPLSQDNISKLTGFSKAKVNGVISELINRKYITSKGNARYTINKTSFEIYNMLEK